MNMLENSEFAESMDSFENENEDFDKGLFWKKETELIETQESVRHELELAGIKETDLDGMREVYQEKLAEAVSEMVDNYPELRDFIGKVSVKDLSQHIYALTGPRMGKDGFYTEIQFNLNRFSKVGLEYDIADSETENYKGERWFAGKGLKGIVEHELAHLLHLKLISQDMGLDPGDTGPLEYMELKHRYMVNDQIEEIIQDAMNNLGIEKRDLKKELSIYGASDPGECFAEAISEHETSDSPRRLSNEIYRLYKEKIAAAGIGGRKL